MKLKNSSHQILTWIIVLISLFFTPHALADNEDGCKGYDEPTANFLKLVGEGNCIDGIYYLADEVYSILRIKLDPTVEYDLEYLCLPLNLSTLRVNDLNRPLPDCISKLTHLTINNKEPYDVEMLSNLNTLTNLRLMGTKVSGELNLPNIQTLELKGPDISDLVISDQMRLTNVTIEGIPDLKDLSIIAHQTALEYLDFTYYSRQEGVFDFEDRFPTNSIFKDFSALSNFTQLKELKFWKLAPGIKFPVLDNHPHLETIDFQMSHFDYFEQIRALPNLKHLIINRTKSLTDISGLAGMQSLETLDFWEADVRSFDPVAGLKNLKTIKVAFGNPYLSDLTNYFAHPDSNAEFDLYFKDDLMRCSPRTREEYDSGKRCNQAQQEHCGGMPYGKRRMRRICEWWYSD